MYSPRNVGYTLPAALRTWSVETRFETRVLDPGSENPRFQKEFHFSRSVASNRIPSFDPRVEARRRALERIAEASSSALCGERKKLRRAKGR